MTIKRLILFVLVSGSVTAFWQLRSIANYETSAKQISTIMCDVVATRAQAGSTRDVYDQVFAFLRKHSPDSNAQVTIRRAGKEYGSRVTLDGASSVEDKCEIADTPDYQIIMRFRRMDFFSTSTASRFGLVLLTLLLLYVSVSSAIAWAKKIWVNQILTVIKREMGLSLDDRAGATSWIGRNLASRFMLSLESLKEPVEKLKCSIENQQVRLTEQNSMIASFLDEKGRADRFAESVRQVRHDLRGPVSALKVFLSDRGSHAVGDDDVVAATLRTVEKIVADLEKKQTLEQPTSQTPMLEIAEMAIFEIIETIRTSSINRPNLKFDFQFDRNILSPVAVDPSLFRRVLFNILQNAIESMPGEGLVKIVCLRDGSALAISVEDNGKGIEKDIIPLLFQREATFGKPGGTGLGLYFSKNCITQWGGEISLESNFGEGTTVNITLPLKACQASFQGAIETNTRLVVLDDEVDLQKPAWRKKDKRAKFFKSPYEFMHWFDSEENNGHCQLVIDLHLRESVNGLDVIRTIGKRPGTYLATSDYLNTEAIELSGFYEVPIVPKSLLFALS